MKTLLKLAVQKSGRLSESSLKLIRECGITFNARISKLKANAYNFPIEFLYLRDDDIPRYVADGIADVGIIGENVQREKNHQLKIIERLGFSKCRLSIAVPRNYDYVGPKSINNMKIATSYPVILQQFLDQHGIGAEIHEISGSVEIAPSIGLAEAVCDIVSTGSTLVSNGLKEVETIMESEAVLVSQPALQSDKAEVLEKLLFRIRSVRKAKSTKYILMNVPDESIPGVIELLPGMRSPTVVPLATKGWSSVHSVVAEDAFWEVIDKLRAAGAEGILVVPIEKMIL
ncbi:MAG: ATP phosphoribosyltransferase [Cyclobacteriaceae bacterium]